jgi:hypothetical protein
MWFHAALATAVMTLAVTPARAAKITVRQYGRLVVTLPWAVALQKNMFAATLAASSISADAGSRAQDTQPDEGVNSPVD